MSANSPARWVGLCAVMFGLALATASAQTPGQSLGSVRLTQTVKANGQDLPAGTYTLRLTSDAVAPVVGQSPDAAQWVEFVQGGQVKGKELATKVAAAEVKQIAKMAPPAAGASKVQMLKGADYVRVWLNRAGTHYLVHLSTTAK
jgi:hypothetical protein